MVIFNSVFLLALYLTVGVVYFVKDLKLFLGWGLIGGILLVNCVNFILVLLFQCQDITEIRRRKKNQALES